MLCILNVGTVPTLCILYVGTVPMLCILNVGTVPTFSPPITFRHVPMISLTFKVLFVKLCSLMLCLGLSVPEDVPRCSASVLTLLASFLNSVRLITYS